MSIPNTQPTVSTRNPQITDREFHPPRFRKELVRGNAISPKKRKKQERTFRYYLKVLHKVMTALAMPAGIRFYVETILINLGFDGDPLQWMRLEDREAVETVTTAFRTGNEGEIKAQMAKLRKQRERHGNWGEEDGNPSRTIEHRLTFEPDPQPEGSDKVTGKTYSEYRVPLAKLIREIIELAPVSTSDEWLDSTIRTCVGEFIDDQKAFRRKPRKRRKRSDDANISQGLTLILKGLTGLEARENHSAAERTAMGHVLPQLRDFLTPEILSKLSVSRYLTNTPPVTTVTAPPPETEREGQKLITENSFNNVLKNQGDSPASLPEIHCPEHCVSSTVTVHPVYGQTVEEFCAQTFGAASAPTPEPTSSLPPALPDNGWRDLAITDRQRDLLSRGGHFDFSITRGQASDRINDLITSGALCDFLSIAELDQFDRKGGRKVSGWRRWCCPLCHGNRRMDDEHRSLAVQAITGGYVCHRCDAKGIVREHLTSTPIEVIRSFPAPVPEPKTETDDKWRKFVADAKPISGTKGAAYIESRGFPADVAQRAGVKFGRWWKASNEGDKPEPFEAVIFELVDREGQMVAAQARAITGDTKRTRGNKSEGIFESFPGALESARVAITEAPIDALALAAAGLPAIAICGKTGPEWLSQHLAGREIVIATDADKDGDKIAANLAKLMRRTSPTIRLRPAGGKDWSEIAQKHGLDSVAEQIAFALGAGENPEDHDSPLTSHYQTRPETGQPTARDQQSDGSLTAAFIRHDRGTIQARF